MLEGGLYLRPVLFDEAARVRQRGGKIFAIPVVERVILDQFFFQQMLRCGR